MVRMNLVSPAALLSWSGWAKKGMRDVLSNPMIYAIWLFVGAIFTFSFCAVGIGIALAFDISVPGWLLRIVWWLSSIFERSRGGGDCAPLYFLIFFWIIFGRQRPSK